VPLMDTPPEYQKEETTMEASTHALDAEPISPRTGLAAWRSRPAVRFGLHYLEMIAVMFAGMGVVGGGLVLAAAALGFGASEIEADAPALILAGMGFSMTAPMVWWMRFRGHMWPATRAMATSMIAPTLAAIALLAAGAVTDLDGLLAIQHVAMFPAMFTAMLLHRGEYTGHDHAG
jgi:hypothetical protein